MWFRMSQYLSRSSLSGEYDFKSRMNATEKFPRPLVSLAFSEAEQAEISICDCSAEIVGDGKSCFCSASTVTLPPACPSGRFASRNSC